MNLNAFAEVSAITWRREALLWEARALHPSWRSPRYCLKRALWYALAYQRVIDRAR